MLAESSFKAIADQLYRILPGKEGRERMLSEYREVRERLGNQVAPDEAAAIMLDLLVKRREMLVRLAKERAEAEAKAAAEAAERARLKPWPKLKLQKRKRNNRLRPQEEERKRKPKGQEGRRKRLEDWQMKKPKEPEGQKNSLMSRSRRN